MKSIAIAALLVAGAFAVNTMLSVGQDVKAYDLDEWRAAAAPKGLPYTGLWVWGHMHTTDGSDRHFNVILANTRGYGVTPMSWEDFSVCNDSAPTAAYTGELTYVETELYVRNYSTSDNGATYMFTIYKDGTIEYKDTNLALNIVSHPGGCRFEWRSHFNDSTDDIVYRSRIGDVSGTVQGHPVEGIFGTDGYWGNKMWALTPSFYAYEREWVVFYDVLLDGRSRYGTTVWGPMPLRTGYTIISKRGDRNACASAQILTEDVLAYNEDQECSPKPNSLLLYSQTPLFGVRSYVATQYVANVPIRPDLGITLHEVNAFHIPPLFQGGLISKSYAWWEHVQVN